MKMSNEWDGMKKLKELWKVWMITNSDWKWMKEMRNVKKTELKWITAEEEWMKNESIVYKGIMTVKKEVQMNEWMKRKECKWMNE